MSEQKIVRSLTLCFPHRATVSECETIARYAQKFVGAIVSEGGFTIKSMAGDHLEFESDTMQFVYGYSSETVSPEGGE